MHVDTGRLIERDGDGVTDKAFSGDDCDDGDASVGAPGALYVDGDGDGVGGGTEAVGCSGDAGLVALGGDCDDADATIAGAVNVYADADGDGYASDDAVATLACPGSAGVVALGDCNDDEPGTFPGAPEDCLASIDSDCDGDVGGAGCSVDSLVSVVLGIDAGVALVGAEFPEALLVQDVDGDGFPEVVASAPYAFVVAAFSAETLVGATTHTVDEAVFRFDAQHPQLGTALASANVVGDETPDLLIGCPSFESGVAGEGAYVLAIELPADSRETEADALVYGVQALGFFGESVVGVGQVDGVESVMVGAVYESGSGAGWLLAAPWPEDASTPADALASVNLHGLGNRDGTLALVGSALTALRTSSGTLVALAGHQADAGVAVGGAVALWSPDFGEAEVVLSGDVGVGRYGAREYEFFGYALASWDSDGDGLDSLAVGAPYALGQENNVGAVYVFHRPEALVGWKAHDADLVLLGDDRNDDAGPLFGAAMVAAGDMNGDGLDELAVGAPTALGLTFEPQAGAVFIVPGGITDDKWDVEEVTWARYGDRGFLHTGDVLAGGKDIDGDGRADLVVGMPGWTDPGGGGVIGAFAIWWGDLL